MATTLQFPYSQCTAVATNPHRHRPISPLSPPKPSQSSSQLFLNARRRRQTITCSVDRRNMLLGLGGLYGAGKLIISDEKAQANPIKPPDFDSCQPNSTHDYGTGEPIDINCCPPVSDEIIDYKLPPVRRPRVRMAAHKLPRDYLEKYKEALRRMRELDVTDPSDPRGFKQQAMIHCAYCNGAHDQPGHPGVDISVHYSWVFFPFHRWYIYFYERNLGSLIGDPHFALPFWNWDHPKGMHLPRIFDDPNSPLYDAKRDPKHRPPAVVNLTLGSTTTDPNQLVSNNLSAMYHEMIGGVNQAYDFMGKPYKDGDSPPPVASGGTSERGSHIGIHGWVGDPANKYREDLGNFYSSGWDPAFFCHHSNVDRMWTIWKEIKTRYKKEIHDLDYLNSSFLFYDEHKRLVRVKTVDCLDYTKMGYKYETIDTPWMHYRPTKKTTKLKIEDISKETKRGDDAGAFTLKEPVRVLVSVPSDGRDNHALLLKGIETDSSKMVKFDVYVNEEDDDPQDIDKAEYAGTFAQLPHKGGHSQSQTGGTSTGTAPLTLSLKELYENIDIADDDDTVLVTIVPRINGESVTISGGVEIIALPPPPSQ